jgi:hypothetical protein
MVTLLRAFSVQLSAKKHFESLERLMPMPHRGGFYSRGYLWLAPDCVAPGRNTPPAADKGVKKLTQENPKDFLSHPLKSFLYLAPVFLMHGVANFAGDFVQAQGLVDNVHLLQVKELLGLVPLMQHDDEAGGRMTEAGAFKELLIIGLTVVGDDQVKGVFFQDGQGFGHRVHEFEFIDPQEFDHRS